MVSPRRGTGGKETAARTFESYIPGVHGVFWPEKRVSGCVWLHLQTVARRVGKGRVMDFHAGLREIDGYCRSKETWQRLVLVLYATCPSYYLLAKGWLMNYNMVERFTMAWSGLNMFGGWANG